MKSLVRTDSSMTRLFRMTAPPAPSGLALTTRAAIAPWWLRAAFVAAGLGLWFWTQSLIGQREFGDGGIVDVVHRWTAGLHDTLLAHPRAANALLIISSAVIDLAGVSLLAATL